MRKNGLRSNIIIYMNGENLNLEDKVFEESFKRFQGFLIKKIEEGSFYKDDNERHAKEAEMGTKYGEKFREIVDANPEIRLAIMSGEKEKAAQEIIDRLGIQIAA